MGSILMVQKVLQRSWTSTWWFRAPNSCRNGSCLDSDITEYYFSCLLVVKASPGPVTVQCGRGLHKAGHYEEVWLTRVISGDWLPQVPSGYFGKVNFSELGHGKSLLSGLPDSTLDPLQSVLLYSQKGPIQS